MKIFNIIPTACFLTLISFNTNANVPVVDDSENYALLEEQQTALAPSVDSARNDTATLNSSEQALAHDINDDELSSDSLDAYEKIKGLRQEVQELRGQIEILTHELNKLKEQQLAFYKDLDARITNKQTQPLALEDDKTAQKPIETNSATNNTSTIDFDQSETNLTTKGNPNTSPADEQISYLAAFELVKNKQFSQAIPAMKNFIAKFPHGFYASNAEYWLGELYLSEKNYSDAALHFDTVLQKYPTSNKYSASLLKMGYVLADSGKITEAKQRLQEVIKKYPDTSTARLAQTKLEEIRHHI